MGKQRIAKLLEQLEAVHQADVENAAAIYTVAQVAVHQLEQHLNPAGAQETLQGKPAAIATLSPFSLITVEDLKRQYGSFNDCRQAAKAKGIRFRKTPSWEKLAAAFSYFETFQTLIQTHLAAHPSPNLQGVQMEFKLN